MMKFLCLVILFVGCCECADDDQVAVPKNYWIGEVEDDYEDKGIWRPCPKYDLECVRYYFSKNARCIPSYGRIPDPLYMSQLALPLVNSNLTVVLTKVQTKGLNGKVVEFFVNKMSDKVVLSVEFRGLTVFSGETIFRYQRKAKEPIVNSDSSVISYTSVTLTAVLPYSDDLQLDKAEFNAYIDDAKPRLIIGRNANKSKDPVVQKSFAHLIKHPNENVREAFLVQAPLYMKLFIQNRICNFELKDDIY